MKRPSAPIIISSAALFFSLTGAGLAASRYVITSTSQIKRSVVKALHGKPGPTGPAGTAGAAGQPGTAGTPGVAGAPGVFSASDITVVTGPQVSLTAYGTPGFLRRQLQHALPVTP